MKLITQIKESIIFLGFLKDNNPVYTGTGFLIQVDNIFYVVTAKHVVEKDFKNMFIFRNSKNFGINYRPIAEILQKGLSWKVHQNSSVDIAMLPFIMSDEDRVKFVPKELFIDNEKEISELTELFFGSYQPGINDLDKQINSVVRKGVVSRINPEKTFYMDGFAFPGNSGSPVFLLPTSIKIDDNGSVQIGAPMQVKLAGIIGAYVPYEDVAISQQTGRIKNISTENTGLALVHSTILLNEITRSDSFQEQHQTILQDMRKNQNKEYGEKQVKSSEDKK
ncbi:MAG TPA: serine protease [Candidatus Kaiserbacteria bacterium]|nr:serine protease [Candidatus Kaiserbacteria bacterium]